MSEPTALIVAPYYRRPHHLGGRRVSRFLRWLHGSGWRIVLVRAGVTDREEERSWGREIVIRDPLGLHPDGEEHPDPLRRREFSAAVRAAAMLAFNPDPGVVWGRRVLGSQRVAEAAAGADMVLASSPPESVHLVAEALAGRAGARFLADLRDGWLDEPLKPILDRSALQRWREGRLERKVLTRAETILVTSEIWREMLLVRYPLLDGRVRVLPNSYPAHTVMEEIEGRSPVAGPLTLVYAGQFRGSKPQNLPSLLLEPLWRGLEATGLQARVILQGRFTGRDLREIGPWQEVYASAGSSIECRPPQSPDRLQTLLVQAHGLLLLSVTRAAVVAKVYDYLPVRRPILAVTPRQSSIWRLAGGIPQIFPAVAGEAERAREGATGFLAACATGNYESVVPEEFTEEFCRRQFLELVPRYPSLPAAPPDFP